MSSTTVGPFNADRSRHRDDSIKRRLQTIGAIASLTFVVIAVTARVPTYRVSPVFLIPLLWVPYFLRRVLALSPVSFALFASAILLHDLGAYGFYQKSPLGFSWDIAVHYWFGVVAAWVLRGAIASNFPELRPWQVNVTTLLFVMGFGALHEIMEYMSYLLLGESKGMLKPTTSYFFDTQRDLLNNLLGVLTSLCVGWLVRRASATGTPQP